MELVADLAGAQGEDLVLHRELEGAQLLAHRERAEVDEEELTGRERERFGERLHHDLGDELVEAVRRHDAIRMAPYEQVHTW